MISQHNNRGFSLIEILAAFSIAAVSLAIIFQIYAKGTTAAILGEEYARAIAIAESRLAQAGIDLSLNDRGANGIEDDKYHWIIQVEEFIPADESAFTEKLILNNVRVDVSWENHGKQRSVTLMTLKPSTPL